MIKRELLDILACPRCKERVILSEDGGYIICRSCKLRYPIVEDIPIMLIDKAEPIS